MELVVPILTSVQLRLLSSGFCYQRCGHSEIHRGDASVSASSESQQIAELVDLWCQNMISCSGYTYLCSYNYLWSKYFFD